MNNTYYRFTQCPIRGFYTNDPEYIFIKALNQDDAMWRLRSIVQNIDDSCDCCGKRWREGEYTSELTIYGQKIEDYRLENPDKVVLVIEC